QSSVPNPCRNAWSFDIDRSSPSVGHPCRQMDTNPVEYWDAQARDYDGNIFSTIDEDVTGIITETLDRHAHARGTGPFSRCIDLGCGAGKYLAALSARFGTVVAYDLSPKLV
ncbi:unnamed protein product, partial [Prorocentrum cordatum]